MCLPNLLKVVRSWLNYHIRDLTVVKFSYITKNDFGKKVSKITIC